MPFPAFHRWFPSPAAPLAAAIVLQLGLAAPAAQEQAGQLRFVDTSAAAGIEFIHHNGARGDKHLPETMGSGVAWADFDRDGLLDLYLVQGGPLPGAEGPRPGNVLYRNQGAGVFTATTGTGLEDRGYGMGVTVADYDDDGFADVYVTNFGPNALYRNNGDGTFSLQADAGVAEPRWSSSAAWGDLDGDGDLDLYVANYVVYDIDSAITCGDRPTGALSYCHIDLFDGLTDALFRNQGDGTFVDVAEEVGVANASEGKGLGVVLADLDDDGRTDIYVANDTQQNFLYQSLGDGTFADEGLLSGTGYSAEGKAEAGMGTDAVDLDGDGVDEILVTNFAFEPVNVYRRFAPGAYLDESFGLGIGEPSLSLLAFGIVHLDADGDGDREVVVANGHILDDVERVQDGTSYEQPNQLFENRLDEHRREAIGAGTLDPAAPGDWRPARDLFREISERAGDAFALREVTRGLAVGDADGDGRPDLALTNSAGPARLLANRSAVGNRLVLRLRGRDGNRDALGTKVVVTPLGADPAADGAAGFPQHAEVRSASSYLSQNALDLYFGLGDSREARIEVVWPDGNRQRFESLPAGHLALLFQGGDAPVLRALAEPAR